jgi:hypothetical protein
MQSFLTAPYLWPLLTLLIGAVASIAGGALAGLAIGSRHLGPKLAAMMSALFGPLAGVPGLAIGLLAMSLLGVRAG